MKQSISNIKKTLTSYCKKNSLAALLIAKIWYASKIPLAFICRLKFIGKAHIPISVKLIGIKNIYIGKNSAIGANTWLNVNERSNPKLSSIVIGENSFIGQSNFFTTGSKIILGPYCLTAKNCSFIGSSHIYENPLAPYATTGTSNKDTIIIGTNCFFGYGAQVIGNVTIGHGSVIGAGAVVKSDVPPFSIVVGNPARVIKRYDFKSKTWVRPLSTDEIKDGPSEPEYIEILKKNYGHILQPISASSGTLYDIC